MNKKLVVSLCIIFAVVAVVLILLWTLFGLASVEVSIDSTTKNLSLSNEEIVEAGKFRYGASVIFEGKKRYVNNLTQKAVEDERFAYIKVVNIETVFPNKYVVHIVEREELFAIENDGQFFICDHELRVLRKESEFVSDQTNAVLIEGVEIKNPQLNVGDFLETDQTFVKKIYSAFSRSNRSLSQILAKFEKITIDAQEPSIKLQTFDKQDFVVVNPFFALDQKIQLMFAVESAIFQDLDKVFELVETPTHELVMFDEQNHQPEERKILTARQILKDYYIKVDNLTLSDYVKRTEKDIYYCFCRKSVEDA